MDLTSEQVQTLRGLESRIKQAKEDIARAKRAGLDVGDLDDRLSEAEKLRAGMLREFGPSATRR